MGFRPEEKGIKTFIDGERVPRRDVRWDSDLKKKGLRLAGVAITYDRFHGWDSDLKKKGLRLALTHE